MLGVATDTDTDGEGSSPPPQRRPTRKAEPKKAPPKKAPPKKVELKVDPETGEILEGVAIKSPQELLLAINSVVPYYNHEKELYNTMRKHFDPKFSWNIGPEGYAEAFALLVDHAKASTSTSE
jgi:hypothetical protein